MQKKLDWLSSMFVILRILTKCVCYSQIVYFIMPHDKHEALWVYKLRPKRPKSLQSFSSLHCLLFAWKGMLPSLSLSLGRLSLWNLLWPTIAVIIKESSRIFGEKCKVAKWRMNPCDYSASILWLHCCLFCKYLVATLLSLLLLMSCKVTLLLQLMRCCCSRWWGEMRWL